MRANSSPEVPRLVFHGTNRLSSSFDLTNQLGAHFGSAKAACQRMRDRAILALALDTYRDENDAWWLIGAPGAGDWRFGPFSSEGEALQVQGQLPHCSARPWPSNWTFVALVLPDLG